MEKIDISQFKAHGLVNLKEFPTRLDWGVSKDEVKKSLKNLGKKLSEFQDTLYAHNRYGVLVCLQGMDTSGKDSLVREVFSRFNPRGVVVHSFKVPTSTELQHDYLWRHYLVLPEKGKFAVFNRSHYENVLVTRVNPSFLLNENLPGIDSVEDVSSQFWIDRYEQINNFEKHIVQNGTIVLKFYLHLSKEEQRTRLLRRIDKQKHNWKFAPSDITERGWWNLYMDSYQEAISQTSVPHAPWYIIPADDKDIARYLVAKVLHEEMKKYPEIKEPELDPKILENLSKYKEMLKKEDS